MNYQKLIETAEKIEKLLRQGIHASRIKNDINDFSEEALSIAKARIKNSRINKIPKEYIFNEEDLRFSTNNLVASYRARRLVCNTILEIGCGIGIQAIEFSKTCKNVIAIEVNERKMEYAKANACIANAKNITFINADAIKALKTIKSSDIIFWDPERLPYEKERNLGSFNPPFKVMMDEARKISEKISVELPPQISRSFFKDCEFEYVSIGNELNRLTAYFGGLRKCSTSVVSLPSMEAIRDEGKSKKPRKGKLKNYLYEIDEAIIKANLLEKFCGSLSKINLFKINENIYLTSELLIKNPFLRSYKILDVVDIDSLKKYLESKDAGKAILHGKIPEKEYWQARGSIEQDLTGKNMFHLFLSKDSIVIASRV